MLTREIFEVTDLSGLGLPHWSVRTRTEQGTIHHLALPHITFAARAAEYGLAFDDIDALIEVGLHEFFAQPVDHTHPHFLYNTDERTARTRLLERVAEAKQSVVTFSDPQNLLQLIRDHHVRAPQLGFYMQHQQTVRELRQQRLAGENFQRDRFVRPPRTRQRRIDEAAETVQRSSSHANASSRPACRPNTR